MAAASHETRVRDFFRDVWNGRDYTAAERLYAASFTSSGAPGLTGAAAKTHLIAAFHRAFPDLVVDVEELVATEDSVAVRYVASGTDLGGFAGHPATGRAFRLRAVSFLHFAQDRVVSEWVGADYLGLFEQLGVVNSPWTRADRGV